MTSPLSLSFLDSTTPLRVGIIGCGWFGGVHVERLSAIPNVLVCAVSDPDTAAAQRLAEKVPAHLRDPQSGVAVYSDYRDLLKHAGLHAVSINSPNKRHVEQLLAALEQGLHVLCEKPLTLIPDEVVEVIEATEKAQRIVALSYQSRYRRDARILQSVLQSGKWGDITFVSIYSQEDWVTPNVGTWRHDPARCPGGFFGDANGHQLDFLFWATGLEASWVRATNHTGGTPVPMVTWGEAELVGVGCRVSGVGENPMQGPGARGQGPGESPTTQLPNYPTPNTHHPTPMTFTFIGTAHHWREEICITTERADFVMRNGKLLWTTGNAPLSPFPESEIDPEVANRPNLPDSAFVAALRGGPPILSPPETVWPVLRFTLATLASAANGGLVQAV